MQVTSSTITHLGTQPQRIRVEVDVSYGLPNFHIVGLPNSLIKEARERVRSAIRNSGSSFPRHRITINLSPAYLRKEGSHFDLPIAHGLLAAGKIVAPSQLVQAFYGELSLSGQPSFTKGVAAAVIDAPSLGIDELFIPEMNKDEALLSMTKGQVIYPVSSLAQLVSHLTGKKLIVPLSPHANPAIYSVSEKFTIDMIAGQDQAKRAVQIAAAGGHHLFLSGPPGMGKSLLAKALIELIPPMSKVEQRELSKLYSLAGLLEGHDSSPLTRPFRSPHHSIALSGLIGRVRPLVPGEITLAHAGVLFLDELPLFSSEAVNALRQPLEDRYIGLRIDTTLITYPAHCLLIGAYNPCPCGYTGAAHKRCFCSAPERACYRKKLPQPILDRIDLFSSLNDPSSDVLCAPMKQSGTQLYDAVQLASQRQSHRFKGLGLRSNAMISHGEIHALCKLSPRARALVDQAAKSMNLSIRTYHRTVRVARTVADLNDLEIVDEQHVAEALTYRYNVSTGMV